MKCLLFFYRQLLNNEIRRRLQEQQDGAQCGQDNERSQLQEIENNHNPE